MKLNLSREALLTPLQKVIGAVERKQTMPALSNVLIKANAGDVTITATDLEFLVKKRPAVRLAYYT